MLRLGAQSKRDEAIYNKLVCVSALCRGKDRFASNLSKIAEADDVNKTQKFELV